MDTYQKKIREWQKTLDTNLRKENSWLALAGLFWLEEGENSFGSGDVNDIVFPNDATPEMIGSFLVQDDNVKLDVTGDTLVDVDGVPAKEASLQPDASGAPTKLKLGALSFILIQREDGFGIRLWDNSRAEREAFPGREWFPAQEGFCIEGAYQRYANEKMVSFERENGADFKANVEGAVNFSLEGKDFSLLAFEQPDGDLFIIFRDATNGRETYGSGRYLSVSSPKDGKVIIDFNRAVNPPCAFTNFPTCPLPPSQNNLPISIIAGEKKASRYEL